MITQWHQKGTQEQDHGASAITSLIGNDPLVSGDGPNIKQQRGASLTDTTACVGFVSPQLSPHQTTTSSRPLKVARVDEFASGGVGTCRLPIAGEALPESELCSPPQNFRACSRRRNFWRWRCDSSELVCGRLSFVAWTLRSLAVLQRGRASFQRWRFASCKRVLMAVGEHG